ncbi:hypothetical protein GCM10009759_69460 [Kitasatospora saccharophila]|uniref:Secreted protein n=1 Tax=Kitasatospora saccharophila TaxID=407973 RepID=A0ABP5JQN1_9ACTN
MPAPARALVSVLAPAPEPVLVLVLFALSGNGNAAAEQVGALLGPPAAGARSGSILDSTTVALSRVLAPVTSPSAPPNAVVTANTAVAPPGHGPSTLRTAFTADASAAVISAVIAAPGSGW